MASVLLIDDDDNFSAGTAELLRAHDHHVVTASAEGLAGVAPHVIALADQEGLAAHAESVRLRLRDLSADSAANGGGDG